MPGVTEVSDSLEGKKIWVTLGELFIIHSDTNGNCTIATAESSSSSECIRKSCPKLAPLAGLVPGCIFNKSSLVVL